MENLEKTCMLLVGIRNSLQIIESALELSAQTQRIRNIVSRGEFEVAIGAAVVAFKQLSTELTIELKD